MCHVVERQMHFEHDNYQQEHNSGHKIIDSALLSMTKSTEPVGKFTLRYFVKANSCGNLTCQFVLAM